MPEKILVTGGAGYIGSHTTLALLEAGYEVIVLDNLRNSSKESLRRVGVICGRLPTFIHGDIRNRALLDELFGSYRIRAVFHFAGLKPVGGSVHDPLDYYNNNVSGSVTLCQAMVHAKVFSLIYSSTATVYGNPKQMPISEKFPTTLPPNPYGRSKLMVEELLQDLANSEPQWRIALLRYFNPVGAHQSGMIGEHSTGLPCNLFPFLSQVAIGRLQQLSVFGDDYPTQDGTGVRDYIHVQDLAEGHVSVLRAILKKTGMNIWNLGTGVGYSVLEIIRAFEQASGRTVSYHVAGRRPGDVAKQWADPEKAALELGWRAKLGLLEIMNDTWRWQTKNPLGYE